MSDTALKAHLFEAYEGFADKRMKKLAKGDTFIVDDRQDTDLASDGSLYSSFCMVFARVVGPNSLEVDLRGNVPTSPEIRDWIATDGSTYRDGFQPCLNIKLQLGQETRLEELATRIEAITRPDAPRYVVPSYKYACPRTATSLRRLARVLREFAVV